jgi:LPXTG-motif cell wall-anchored protein
MAQADQGAGQLPQTASPLPLLGLLGLGSLAVGFFARRKK